MKLESAAETARRRGYAPLPDKIHDWFWTARPILTHLHEFARARRVSPWAALGVALARVCTATPRFIVLPPLVGSTVSLNTFVGLVGPSGAGKDAAARAAEDAVPVGHLDTAGVGSGEGIAHQFMTYRKPNARTGDAGGLEQYREALLMTAAEVDTLAALRQRQASTLLPELRKAWTGDALGFAYVDKEKRLSVGRHQYRLRLVVGIQPERAGPILDDADAGTPQRFLWLPATDPEVPDMPPAEPEPWTDWKLPDWGYADAHGRNVLTVCQTAREVIDTARVARLRGDGDALDGHALLCRLKVAAVLAILDVRADVNDEDWNLAGVIAAKSERTRHGVVSVLADKQRAANTARGKAEADRVEVIRETVSDKAIKRVGAQVARKLAARSYGMGHAELLRCFSSADRDYLDPAIERLVEAGQVILDDQYPGSEDGRRHYFHVSHAPKRRPF